MNILVSITFSCGHVFLWVFLVLGIFFKCYWNKNYSTTQLYNHWDSEIKHVIKLPWFLNHCSCSKISYILGRFRTIAVAVLWGYKSRYIMKYVKISHMKYVKIIAVLHNKMQPHQRNTSKKSQSPVTRKSCCAEHIFHLPDRIPYSDH